VRWGVENIARNWNTLVKLRELALAMDAK